MNRYLILVSLKFASLVPKSILAKLGDLKTSMTKASMKTGFLAYVGLIVFSSFLTAVITFGFIFVLASIAEVALVEALLLSFIFALTAGLSAFGIGYVYPLSVAISRGSKIDANLPNIAHFMAVLASSGMTPESIFRSLARVGKEYHVDKEVLAIIGEIELMGANLHSSLIRVSEVSPSRRFGIMLSGIVSTANMGGDLADYLNDQAKKFKEERVGKVKHFLESLAVVAEGYVAFMVAAPLMLIIMLSVMSIIGGQIPIANIDPNTLLDLLTFVFIPMGVAFLMFMVDSITPLR